MQTTGVCLSILLSVLLSVCLALPVDKDKTKRKSAKEPAAPGADGLAKNLASLEKEMTNMINATEKQLKGDLKKGGVKLDKLPKNYDNKTHTVETVGGKKVQTDTEVHKHDDGKTKSEVIKETRKVDGKPSMTIVEEQIRTTDGTLKPDPSHETKGSDGHASSFGHYTRQLSQLLSELLGSLESE